MNRQFVVTLSLLTGLVLCAQTPAYVSNTQGLTITDLVQSVLSGNRDLQAAREQLRQAEARLLQGGPP